MKIKVKNRWYRLLSPYRLPVQFIRRENNEDGWARGVPGESKYSSKTVNKLIYADDTTLMAGQKEQLKVIIRHQGSKQKVRRQECT